MSGFEIGGCPVGKGAPCFIIAEAGCNHDRKLSQAIGLIDIAAEAGADAVKFQSFSAEKIAAQTEEAIARMGGGETLYTFFKRLELPIEWLGELNAYCDKKGIIFLCTPFDEESADVLNDLGVPAFKIASFELVHLPLIRHIAAMGKPVILSTGMADIQEIAEAEAAMLSRDNRQVAFLHCGINYPADFKEVNLAAMDTIAAAFPYPVGYSDHTLGITVPVAAVARGAKIIEKHFTVDKTLPGGEHYFSLGPDELKDMVKAIRECEQAIGSPVKDKVPSEEMHYLRGRRSIFAKVDITAGTEITAEMLDILRPGIGLKPKHLNQVIGRKAKIDIRKYEPIDWGKI